ncbi:MAG: hypothetical protein HAW67_01190 [Endozoicomonadaceae bacterium]|nr:hypothetical protein [Endozoicomonadaceae bacterium]
MSNLKHGYYSTNTGINPDCVLLANANVKKLLMAHAKDIRDVVNQVIVGVGVTDLVVRLVDCAIPHGEHLLEKDLLPEIYEFYQSRRFSSLKRYAQKKTIAQLVAIVDSFRNN